MSSADSSVVWQSFDRAVGLINTAALARWKGSRPEKLFSTVSTEHIEASNRLDPPKEPSRDHGVFVTLRRKNFPGEPTAGVVSRTLTSSVPSPRIFVCTDTAQLVHHEEKSVDNSAV